MPIKKSAADECCAKCTSDITALKKEVAALKKALASVNKSGAADPRVDKLLDLFDQSNMLRFIYNQMNE